MKTIHKFPIDHNSIISMPKGAKILSAGCQYNQVFLWALVDDEAEKEERLFKIHMTGSEINEEIIEHISTILIDGGRLVVHVFEVAIK